MADQMICPRCWGSTREPLTVDACRYCAGFGAVDDQVLTPHFMLSELLHSDAGARLGLANDPPDTFVPRLRQLAEHLLEPLRARFGALHVNSGYRSPQVNHAVGGAPSSAHLEAYAADVVAVDGGVCRRDLVDWLAASELGFDQVIFEGTWVHVGLYSPGGAQRRGLLMMFPGPAGGSEYFPYDPADPRTAQ